MSNTIQGKVVQVTAHEEVETSKGTFYKQNLIIETEGKYANKICFEAFNDAPRDDLDILNIGDRVKVFYNLISRQWKEKWFTQAKLWKFEIINDQSKSEEDTYDDDLPF